MANDHSPDEPQTEADAAYGDCPNDRGGNDVAAEEELCRRENGTVPFGRKIEADEFRRQALGKQPGVLAEFVEFLLHEKKWWLAPIVIALLLLGVLVFLASTPAAPFIYPF